MKTITSRQRDLLQRIAQYLQDGVPPSAAGLAEDFGLAGESSITPVLKALEKKGYLEIVGGVRGRQRTLRLTARGRAELGQATGLPVLGAIPAGPLREAMENPDGWVEKLSDVLPWKPGDFLLKVQGDSMVEAGILDGDLVLIRPGVEVNLREIAAVSIGSDHQATLKRVVLEGDSITLIPANQRYAPQTFPAQDVRVVGVYRGLIRP